MKKLGNLLKKITKVVDKYIVMPTTRLVFKISNGLSPYASQKNIDSSNSWAL